MTAVMYDELSTRVTLLVRVIATYEYIVSAF